MGIKVMHIILAMDISLIIDTKEAILKTAMGIRVNMDTMTMDMEASLTTDIKGAQLLNS